MGSSEVRWNGEARPTNFISSSQLQAAITAADIVTTGTATVTVFNPSPGGGLSEPLSFSVVSPTTAPGVSNMQVQTQGPPRLPR